MKRKYLSLIMFVMLLLMFNVTALANTSITDFTSRTSAPELTNRYYCPPYNAFSNDDGRGNCTWYAYGRAYEILKEAPVFNGNAKQWWGFRDNYGGYGDIDSPKVGSIAVWDGDYGHVAVVEKVYDDGSVDLSESSFGGVWYTHTYWGRRKYSKIEMLNLTDGNGKRMTFLGYIYLANDKIEEVPQLDASDLKCVSGGERSYLKNEQITIMWEYIGEYKVNLFEVAVKDSKNKVIYKENMPTNSDIVLKIIPEDDYKVIIKISADGFSSWSNESILTGFKIKKLDNTSSGWVQDASGWKYQKKDGTFITAQWFEDNDGKQYYFDTKSYMVSNGITPDGYRVGEDGALIITQDNKHSVRLLFDSSGYLDKDINFDNQVERIYNVGKSPTFKIARDQFLNLDGYYMQSSALVLLDEPIISHDFVVNLESSEISKGYVVNMYEYFMDLERTLSFDKIYKLRSLNILVNTKAKTYEELFLGEPENMVTLNLVKINLYIPSTEESISYYFDLSN